LYTDVLFATLPAAARRYLEGLMKHLGIREYQSDFVRKYIFQGRAEGHLEKAAELVLAVLDARGLRYGDAARRQIMQCTDLVQLEAWHRLAITAESIRDLLPDVDPAEV
jgi:hypothetical protein